MIHADRPTDMLLRQLLANRSAAQFRHPSTGRRHFAHDAVYRSAFVRDILAIRRALKDRAATNQEGQQK